MKIFKGPSVCQIAFKYPVLLATGPLKELMFGSALKEEEVSQVTMSKP